MSPSDFICWNTGRLYTEHGQRMVAFWFDDRILFADFDRGISGEFTPTIPKQFAFKPSIIMSMYDHNKYRESWESREFKALVSKNYFDDLKFDLVRL